MEDSSYYVRTVLWLLTGFQIFGDFRPFWIRCESYEQIWFVELPAHCNTILEAGKERKRDLDEDFIAEIPRLLGTYDALTERKLFSDRNTEYRSYPTVRQ